MNWSKNAWIPCIFGVFEWELILGLSTRWRNHNVFLYILHLHFESFAWNRATTDDFYHLTVGQTALAVLQQTVPKFRFRIAVWTQLMENLSQRIWNYQLQEGRNWSRPCLRSDIYFHFILYQIYFLWHGDWISKSGSTKNTFILDTVFRVHLIQKRNDTIFKNPWNLRCIIFY